MSKTQIVRKSFNGGEIAPDLWYRSDLEAYHSSCKSLLNMNVTPWGGAERRPPMELLAKIDTATYGVPVKYLPFKFSLTETFHVVFTDGSGSASPSASTADLIVFDSTGTLVTLTGASTKILDTVYDPGDLLALHYIQVNDFVYMACGGSYPVQSLNRFFDDAQAGNRWAIAEFELKFGPYDTQNVDPQHTMSINVPAYNAGTTYAAGAVVSGSISTSSTVTVTAIHWVMKSSTEAAAVVECSTPHGLSGGDRVTLTGCTHNARWITSTHLGDPLLSAAKSINLDATYSAVSIYSPNTFEINEWVTKSFFNNDLNGIGPSSNLPSYAPTLGYVDSFKDYVSRTASVSGSFANSGTNTIEATFVSQQASNTGNGLDDAAWWAVGGATSGVQVANADVVSNEDIFTSDDVGRLLAIKDIADERLEGAWNSNQSSNPVNGYGTVTLKTEGGAWGGLLELQQSTDDLTTWETIGSIRSENGESNGSIERVVTGSTTALRVRLTDWAAPSGNYETEKCVWQLSFAEQIFQFFEITAVADAQNATVETISPLLTSLSSSTWKFGEFSSARGYPRTLAIHNERMHFGGSIEKPNTVWASVINDWNNFLLGDLDTAAYTFTPNTNSFDAVRWMRSARKLMVGTDNAEVTMGTLNSSEAVTPTNIQVENQTYYGSCDLQAIVTADLVFFVQGQAKRVRTTQYDFGSDQYLSSEMSIYAHHITEAGIKEMSFTRDPYSLLFFTMEDGKAVTFTYERDNAVKGWARLELGGSATLVSAASNYTPAGDSIFGIVLRNGEYTLEGFTKTTAASVYLDGQIQFVDQDYSAGVAVPINSTGAVVVRNDALLDPADYTIAANVLTIPGATDGTVTIGWPTSFEIAPTNPIETGDFGTVRRVEDISLYLIDSGGCDITINGSETLFSDSLGLAATERLDGEYELSADGGYDSKVNVVLSGNHHRPFKIVGMGFDVSRHS